MLVYRTRKFEEQLADPATSDVRTRVEDFCARIESTPNQLEASKIWQYHDRGYLKSRIGKYRILGKFRTVDDQAVCVLFAVVHRGSDEYEGRFLMEVDHGTIQRTFSVAEFENWVRTNRTERLEATAPQLPENLRKWLEPPSESIPSAFGSETFIYESESWAEASATSSAITRLAPLAALLTEISQRPIETRVNTWCEASGDQGLSVKFSWPSPTTLYLSHLRINSMDDRTNMDVPSMEELPRQARRAYPTYLLADLDLWGQIQKGTTSNLALSPEENEILSSIGSSGADGHGLPVFIDGRAGSGKSTMLAHIFAGLYGRMVSNDMGGTPIFLTYGSGLQQRAKESVRSLLETHHDYLTTLADIPLDDLFVDFRTYLRRAIEDADSRHPREHHVVFHDFKLAYLGQESKIPKFMARRTSRISPEVAWFVIRSLIKGAGVVPSDRERDQFGLDTLDPGQEFDELPREDRSVSSEIFGAVYDGIYNSWYLPVTRDAGLWDDQDLVQSALASNRSDESFALSAVVCDEAQDFTRRELRFLIRNSVYARYDLTKFRHSVRLPFVFAGDPLQTISPTGFRWDQFTSAMYEETIAISNDQSKVGRPQRRELRINYRSSGEIVYVTNAIQQLRVSLLRLTGVKPQIPWKDRGATDLPKKFILGAGISADQFLELTRNSVIIVPCEESGESDFVRNDPVLKGLLETSSGDTDLYNVFSSSAAKGLEFPRVVLYGFGEAMPDIPAGHHELESDDERLYELKHFFNKLYVAATRAEQYLYIVDTKHGDERLWNLLSDDQIRVRTSHGTGAAFRDMVDPILAGSQSDFQSVGSSDPLENAEKLAKSGRGQGIAAHLRQAAGYYRRSGKAELARRCEAEAMRMDGRYSEAAEIFDEVGDLMEEWTTRWWGQDWQRLDGMGVTAPTGVIPADQLELARFMSHGDSSDSTLASVATLLLEMLKTLSGDADIVSWRAVATELVVRTSARAREGELNGALLALPLESLAENAVPGAGSLAGVLHFDAERWSEADRVWRRHGHSRSSEVALAHAYSIGLPEGLVHLAEGGHHQQVVDLWLRQGRPMDSPWLSSVADSLHRISPRRYGDELDVLCRLGRLSDAIDLLAKSPLLSSAEHVDLLMNLAGAVGESSDLPMMMRLVSDRVMRSASGSGLRPKMRGRMAEGFVSQAINDGGRWGFSSVDADLQELLTSWSGVQVDPWSSSDGREHQSNFRTSEVSTNPLIIGAMFELAGHFVSALRFYESLVEDGDSTIRLRARQRWLVVKEIQIDAPRNSRDRRSLTSQRDAKLRTWRMDRPEFSVIPRVADLIASDRGRASSSDHTDSFARDGSHGSLRWERRGKWLTLTWEDDVEYGSVRVDLESRQVSSNLSVRDGTRDRVPLGPIEIHLDYPSRTLEITENGQVSQRGVW